MTRDRLVRALEKVFEEERTCLLTGDLGRLPHLAHKKTSLLEQAQTLTMSPDLLRRFAALSRRNQALIAAAQDGLNAALARLTEIRRGAPVGTYGRNGTKSEFGKPVRTMQRRA